MYVQNENKTEIQKKIYDILENKFESPDSILQISTARFHRFVFSEKRKEKFIPPYGLKKDELIEEGQKLIDKYIDKNVAECKDDYQELLVNLCYPIYMYSSKRGYELFCQD